jgi:hypothetical protein
MGFVITLTTCSPGGAPGVSRYQVLARSVLRVVAVVGTAVAVSAISVAPAASEGLGATTPRRPAPRAVAARESSGELIVARDISFPQCSGALPRLRGADFGVLGANNGIAFTRNPCLARQLAWAKKLQMAPAFYANTGNPGPRRAKHWPLGQTSPQLCSAADPNSIGCSYDYGWNAAWQSYATAVDAAQHLHHVDRVNARQRVANVDWWLDVETMNSWQALDGLPTRAAQRRDVATIAGGVDALRAAGIEQVGIYSTAFQWGQITGGSKVTQGRFATAPQWLAGYESQADAVNGCGHRGFTGGPVRLTQYLARDGFDADVVCTTPDGF